MVSYTIWFFGWKGSTKVSYGTNCTSNQYGTKRNTLLLQYFMNNILLLLIIQLGYSTVGRYNTVGLWYNRSLVLNLVTLGLYHTNQGSSWKLFELKKIQYTLQYNWFLKMFSPKKLFHWIYIEPKVVFLVWQPKRTTY